MAKCSVPKREPGVESKPPELAPPEQVLQSLSFGKDRYVVGHMVPVYVPALDRDIGCKVVMVKVGEGRASVFLESHDPRYKLRRRLDVLNSGVVASYDIGGIEDLKPAPSGDQDAEAVAIQDLLGQAEPVVFRQAGDCDVARLEKGLTNPAVPEDRKERIRKVIAQALLNRQDAAAEKRKIEAARKQQVAAQAQAGNAAPKAESAVIMDTDEEEAVERVEVQ
ncbi:MAG: hypothetical protein FD189_1101 [Elusimicrobia bacterium]|nr:MAG: hypothetical protein FD189_1101 [Elusimicrobiota bacterium]